jgi:hypothetical protein
MIKEPYECFKIVESIKHHMAGRVDIVKYGWNTKVNTPERYETLKGERFLYKRILEKFDGDEQQIKNYAASAYLRDPSCWVGSLGDFEAEYQQLKEWNTWPLQKTILELEELKSNGNLPNFKGIIEKPKTWDTTLLTDLVMRYEMDPEMYVHIDRCFGIGKYCMKRLKGNFIWDIVGPRLKRYTPFVMVESESVIDEIRNAIMMTTKS